MVTSAKQICAKFLSINAATYYGKYTLFWGENTVVFGIYAALIGSNTPAFGANKVLV